jgi:protein TonB
MKKLLLFMLFLSFTVANAQYNRPAETLTNKTLLKDYFLQHQELADTLLQKIKNGKVIIEFTVDESGQTSDFKIVKSLTPEADQEAIRMVKNLIWLPTTKNGNPMLDKQEIEVPFHYKNLQRLRSKGFARPLEFTDYPVSNSQNIYKFAEMEKAPVPVLKNSMPLNQYIQSNLNYPEEAFRRSISGTVSLEFVVEKNGLPSNIIVVASVGGGCDQEAIRLLQSIQWMPAIKQDSLVRSKNHLDISFNLGDNHMQNIPNRQGTSF